MSNAYAAIPDPQNNVESLASAVRALKMTVETLVGQRDGGAAARSFTQPDPPADPRQGDVWISSSDAGRVQIWNGSFWVDVSESRFSSLEKSVDNALASITSYQLAYAEQNLAIAKLVTELKATVAAGNETFTAMIRDEETARATNDMAMAQRLTNLSAEVTSQNSFSVAQVSEERTVRNDADKAVATAVTAATVGTAHVFVQTTPPPATGLVRGDVWYDADDNFHPYYWDGTSWLDNINGTYPSGNVAAIAQTLSAVQNKVDNVLSVQWAVRGYINGVTGGLVLTGIGTADGTGATYNLEITANTTINGNLVVTGTITNTQLANNSVSNNGYAEGGSGVNTTVYCRAGARMSVLATHGGGGAYGFNVNSSLNVSVNGSAIASQSIISAIVAGTIIGATNQFFPAFTVLPTTLLTLYIAPVDGYYTFAATSGASGTLKILVTELSK